MKRYLSLLLLVLALGCIEPNIDVVPPGPPPAPADDVKRAAAMWVCTVDDFATRGTPAGADPSVLEALSTTPIAPHRFREYNIDNPEWKTWKGQVDVVGGPPAVFFLELKTKTPVGKPAKLPARWDDLKKMIDSYTAK
jgi:hypothetical protein